MLYPPAMSSVLCIVVLVSREISVISLFSFSFSISQKKKNLLTKSLKGGSFS